MPNDVEFERVVERLYAAFAHHPMPADMAACEHCVDRADVALFARTPLRKLTVDQLDAYLSNRSTWGDGTEVPHLLPRLFEAFASGEMRHRHADAVIDRMADQWQDWPAAERAAVERFLKCWWQRTLVEFPSTTSAWDLLEAVAGLEVDLGPYLAEFAAVPGEPTARHLAGVVAGWSYHGPLPDGAQETMRRWMAGATPTDVLWTAAINSANPQVADELADAAEAALRPPY
ncbi:hypothetical protein JOD64_002605 [Micromonospora luteifusca]|uniref:Uncharacterized protein n=1 Tax=Micromonospora luteifusca TaxID=709860 RepID=A0ABS2LT75_9ACTN|nr:hypothetical protein [Micromonospora luteifusca]MBM7491383.1 hypothetical protein [Micromonospora luteifusca]